MRLLYIPILFLLAIGTAIMTTQYSFNFMLIAVAGITIFIAIFINAQVGLYILILSMLLSPEIMMGDTASAGTLGRGVTLRVDDFLLAIIVFSYFARNAVVKEAGLFMRTPINRAIALYICAFILSTGFGIMAGRVSIKSGFFFCLKYIEYFIVYFMMVNHADNKDQIQRFIIFMFGTCFIASLVGIAQIPGGERISAPFEGEEGEPNTFGGYLMFIGAIAVGILLKVEDRKAQIALVILGLAILPTFLYTQSRSSYAAAVAASFILALTTNKKPLAVGLVVVGLLISPLFLPKEVKERILFTFTQAEEEGQLNVGGLNIDTSASARIMDQKEAFKAWTKHPIMGHGVTGYGFIDAQLPKILVETGLVGLAAFLYLIFSIYKMAVVNLMLVQTNYYKGIIGGFLAGFTGLLIHSIGSNTFIIVRIMEPFWFMAGIITFLPELESGKLRDDSDDEEDDKPQFVRTVGIRRF